MRLLTYLCGRHAKFFKDKMLTDMVDLPRYCGEYDCQERPEYEVVIEPESLPAKYDIGLKYQQLQKLYEHLTEEHNLTKSCDAVNELRLLWGKAVDVAAVRNETKQGDKQ